MQVRFIRSSKRQTAIDGRYKKSKSEDLHWHVVTSSTSRSMIVVLGRLSRLRLGRLRLGRLRLGKLRLSKLRLSRLKITKVMATSAALPKVVVVHATQGRGKNGWGGHARHGHTSHGHTIVVASSTTRSKVIVLWSTIRNRCSHDEESECLTDS